MGAIYSLLLADDVGLAHCRGTFAAQIFSVSLLILIRTDFPASAEEPLCNRN